MKKLAFLLLLALPLLAQRGPGPEPGPGAPPRLPEYLQLTAAQQTAWQQAHADFRATVEPLRAKEREAHDTLEAKLVAVLTPEQKTKYDAFEAAAAFLRAQPAPPPMK
jgi:Spy/CpxP family protein refolding chaperone